MEATELLTSSPETSNVIPFVFAVLAAPASTSLTLSSSLNPSLIGQAVTFTASLIPAAGPTGIVAFTADGATLSGCGAVALSAGQAQCSTATLAAGSHAIVATYSGDNNYAGSSAGLTQVVNQPVSTVGTFTISAQPPEIEVTAGSSAAYTVTVTSVDGFAGPVALSCSGQPADGACSFAQPSLTLAVRGTASTTMTVTTTTADARTLGTGDFGLGISMLAVLLLPWKKNAQPAAANRAKQFLAASLLLIAVAGLASCGCPTARHQVYTITITGAGTATGSPQTASTSVTLFVH